MAFTTLHNIENGIRQLLDAPNDLSHLVSDQGISRPLSEATDFHKSLFVEYLRDFEVAYRIGDDWWEGCVAGFMQNGYSKDEANELAFEKRLAGPASAPEVVWFFRKYWLKFDELNNQLLPSQRVPPQDALLRWLVEQGHDDYVKFLTCMPYWPIGLDENGNWC